MRQISREIKAKEVEEAKKMGERAVMDYFL